MIGLDITVTPNLLSSASKESPRILQFRGLDARAVPLKLNPLPEQSAVPRSCCIAFAQCGPSPGSMAIVIGDLDAISFSEQVGTFSGKERRLGKRMEEIGEG